jgi:lysylphosphatidylglycerol synthetase-like protein (DUF2156 family)
MGLISRHDEDVRDRQVRTDDRDTAVRDDKAGDDTGRHRRLRFGRPVDRSPDSREELERRESVESRSWRWDFGSVLATAAGVALVLIGAIALVRTGINSSWYSPVVEVAGIDHTPMLGAIELGAGVLLVLAGLAGARMIAALVAVAIGIAAAVVAIEPDVLERDLAIERGWAIGLAVGGLLLAALLVVSRERRHDRRVEHREVRTA